MAGLYFHIPYCTQRCVYCDFYFVTTRKVHTPFVQAIRNEIEGYATEYANYEPIGTLYFGGGTPSLLLPEELESILSTVHEHFDTSQVEEVTFEVNPEDASLEYLRDIKSLGVDRLSIGVQSFFDDDLTFLGRCHDSKSAQNAIKNSEKAGFEKRSIDLIFGLPDQTENQWAMNLELACEMDIPHISTYGLTIEEKTPLWKQVQLGNVIPVDEETHSELFQMAMDTLQKSEYEHYEISSFARRGYRSVHNHRYWSHVNYIGFGPSAHSFWWRGLPARRWSNVRNLNRYQAFLGDHVRPIDEQENLSLDALAREYIMLRLRTSEGLDLKILEERYGVDLLTCKIDELALLESSEFILTIRNQKVILSDLGKTICNSVTQRLLPD